MVLENGKIRVGLKGKPAIVSGALHAKIQAEDSTWIVEDGRTVVLTLEKVCANMWRGSGSGAGGADVSRRCGWQRQHGWRGRLEDSCRAGDGSGAFMRMEWRTRCLWVRGWVLVGAWVRACGHVWPPVPTARLGRRSTAWSGGRESSSEIPRSTRRRFSPRTPRCVAAVRAVFAGTPLPVCVCVCVCACACACACV